jgi:hypothetical protein
VISFETKSIVTTEKAVAAVFVLKRSQPQNGLARVRWASAAHARLDWLPCAEAIIRDDN